MSKPEIFISFDVEADGPSPATNNCLQIALVAVCAQYEQDPDPAKPEQWVVDSLDLCFTPQENRAADSETMTEFWSQYPEILSKIRANAHDPSMQMQRLSFWLQELSERYTINRWVAAPSAYDWQWVNCMYYRYLALCEKSKLFKLPFKAECMSSILKGLEYLGHDQKVVSDYVNRGTEYLPHTHYALEDATEQAYKYLRLRKFMSEQ